MSLNLPFPTTDQFGSIQNQVRKGFNASSTVLAPEVLKWREHRVEKKFLNAASGAMLEYKAI